MASKDDFVVGLDIGTTKVSCIVGQESKGGVDIIGIGTAKSEGLRKGVVVNIDATVRAIRAAVEEAELMAGKSITSVYAGIAGGHIKGLNSRGVVAIGRDREVSEPDIERVIDAARAVAIPMDREVIHILPQEYVIDDNDGVREPIGMSGVRLEAKVHIVTAQSSSLQNIMKCCQRAELNVYTVVLEQLVLRCTPSGAARCTPVVTSLPARRDPSAFGAGTCLTRRWTAWGRPAAAGSRFAPAPACPPSLGQRLRVAHRHLGTAERCPPRSLRRRYVWRIGLDGPARVVPFRARPRGRSLRTTCWRGSDGRKRQVRTEGGVSPPQ